MKRSKGKIRHHLGNDLIQSEDIDCRINARFSQLLPDLIERAALAINAIRPALDESRIDLTAMREHLIFERDKIKLYIEKADWDIRSPPDRKEVLSIRLREIESLNDRLTHERLDATLGFLAELTAAAESLQKTSL